MHTLRHLQRDLGAGQLDVPDIVECAAHPHRSRAGALRVAFTLEPQEQRVAAELEEAGALFIGDFEDRRKAAADRVGDLFGALATALARQLLGQLREAGNIGEHSRTLSRPAATVRIVDQVLLENAGEIRDRAFGVGDGHCGNGRELGVRANNTHVTAPGSRGNRAERIEVLPAAVLMSGFLASRRRKQVTNRRRFIGAVAAGLLVPPWTAHAQSPGKVARIGWLTPEVLEFHTRAFRDAMLALGYVEGKSYVIESRSAADDLGRLPKLAAELVNAKVDIIVAVGPPSIRAAKAATDTIPIVMAFWGSGGLIESGLVANMARPGGNVTGVTMLAAELEAKRLELLLQAVPRARKIAVLDSGMPFVFGELQKVAASTGVQLVMTPAGRGDPGYQRAFEAMTQARVDALLVPSFPRFFQDARQIIDLVAANRIPAIYEWPSMADDGGLMAYGPTFVDLEGRVASFVVRILKGDKPGALPIEQPSKFELVINLVTAKTLGLSIPQPLLLRADRVIG